MKLSHLTRLLVLFVLLALAVFAIAAPPQTINYQGYLKNTDGTPVNAATNLTFSIYSSTSGAGAIWSEQKSVSVSNGIYSTQLGSVSPITATFDVPYWLGVKVGGDNEMTLQPLSSSPYAFRAATAASADSAASSNALAGMTLPNLDGRYLLARTNTPTTEQIATLRWDLAKQGNEFGCGGDPRGIAFDGTYLWVTNYTANTVSRVRPGDGVKVDSFPVGTNPVSVAFDGSDIWVVNYGSNNVSRLHGSDGSGVATYDMGAGAVPIGIAFDGSAMWVTNSGANTVTRINAATGTINSFLTSTSPNGVVFDGDKIWVACSGYNNVVSYRISDGFSGTSVIVGNSPRWLTFDGTYIWVTNNSDGTVMRFQASDGSNATTISVGSLPTGIAFDGRSVWVAVSGTSGIVKLRAADGLNQGTYLVNGTPRRLVFDGSSIWAAVGGLDKLVKLVDAGVAPVPLGVGAGGLADNAVNTGKLMDSAVTSAKIADASVTATKLATNAVGTASIADGVVSAAKLDTAYVKLAGDTMTGQLNLPASGVKIGSSAGAITENWWEFGKNDGVTGTGIDFHGGTTLTDYTARIYRLPGDNASFQITNAGLGNMEFSTGGGQRMVISGSGNVGVGTTNPSNAKLEVNGAIRLLTTPSGNMWNGGLILMDEVTGTNWSLHSHGDVLRMYNGSDETIVGQQTSTLRLKENIAPLTNALEKIKKMNAVSYDFKPEIFSGKHSLGFIAEQMEEIVPEVVTKDESGAPISIDYGLLSTIALQGIKELQEKVDVIDSMIPKDNRTNNNSCGCVPKSQEVVCNSQNSVTFIVPHMSTSQRDAMKAFNGMIIFNTSNNQFNFYENGMWVTK